MHMTLNHFVTFVGKEDTSILIVTMGTMSSVQRVWNGDTNIEIVHHFLNTTRNQAMK